MPLVELKTEFKSKKFGGDRPGGGSSNQPYITREIPSNETPVPFSTGGPDVLNRGGIKAVTRSAQDVSRLIKYFTDWKNFTGPFFTAKVNLLQSTSPLTQASKGVYTPAQTIFQAGSNSLGIRFDLFESFVGQSIRYSDAVKSNQSTEDNRLVKLATGASDNIGKMELNPDSNTIISYPNGPDSLGIAGKTNIRYADNRVNNKTNLETTGIGVNNGKNILTLTPEEIAAKDENLTNSIGDDFRNQILDKENLSAIKEDPTKKNTVLGFSNGYTTTNNIENRVNLGNPGKINKNIYKFSDPELVNTKNALDKITALEPTSDNLKGKPEINDLCKFRIETIDSFGRANKKIFMYFRAFLDGFSDNYSSDWNAIQYVGRGNKFYNYQGFDRGISLSFTSVAQSKAELMPMYRKLNTLASTLAPTYSEGGFMTGNLVKLTVGGYLYEQPGFIKSINYDVPQEATWEIGIDESGGFDSSVQELPHMIKVTGFTFQPIHNFLVQKQSGTDGSYDNERYINLTNGNTSGYE